MLERLARGEATVSELAAPFPLSLQAVSKHLKVLERAGLVARGRDAQRRPATVRRGAIEDATEWLVRYRGIFDDSLDRLDEHLRHMQQEDDDV
jgi:DNA-binding transcriptional ArsR family regulator